jgi:gamma-glutamyltranspeptidase/glutathione hydrolase
MKWLSGVGAWALACWVVALSACSDATSVANPPGNTLAMRQMVATADGRASQAALSMLQAGGNAIDAAIAAQMVLNLVEPQSSGIGGGAFMLVYDPKDRQVHAFDGRETAPAGATPELFLDANNQPRSFYDAVLSGLSVGVPGTLRMLHQVHTRYGQLPWRDLFAPAIRLAHDGFVISPRLYASLKAEADAGHFTDPVALAYFYQADARTPKPLGSVLKNPELEATLTLIANNGPEAFYTGAVATDIAAKVQSNPSHPGTLSVGDLAAYVSKERTALCFDHDVPASAPVGVARAYRVCGMPPPSSGALAVGQILGTLSRLPASYGAFAPWVTPPNGSPGYPDAPFLHLYSEASRLAFADRAMYVADPDFVTDNYSAGLLSASYLSGRAALISTGSRIGTPTAGTLPLSVAAGAKAGKAGKAGKTATRFAAAPWQPEHGTSHLSLVDASGMAVSMTTTIEDAFGSRLMVRGFMLNNELTDFSFPPQSAGVPIANRVQPGKRPRSSMSPVLVFDRADNSLVMSAGSPGGAFIIHYVAKTLWAQTVQGLAPFQAISVPNFGITTASPTGAIGLEPGKFPKSVQDALKVLEGNDSYVIEQASLGTTPSGIQSIRALRADGAFYWQGASDPRREGVVLGN